MTVIGSSNYGERSLKLDLELDVLLLTTNADLRRRIHEEENRIMAYGHSVEDKSTMTGSWLDGVVVWMIMSIINLLGLSI
jgi:CDP-diacylglycerol--glycerol-3-phosphate 3-phosphatidyltransferase